MTRSSSFLRRTFLTFCLSTGLLGAAAAQPSASTSEPALRPLASAHLVWHFSGETEADQTLRSAGAVRLGIALVGEAAASSRRSGGDSRVAEFDGGWLDLAPAQRTLAELGDLAERSIAVRFRASGDSGGTLFARKAGTARNVESSFDLSLWDYPPWRKRVLSFSAEDIDRGSALVSSAPGSFMKVVNIQGEPARDNAWHDLVVRCDGKYLEIFLDGVLSDRRPISVRSGLGRRDVELMRSYTRMFLHAAENTRFGADPFGQREFRGQIDHAAVWNRALDDAEIAALSGGRFDGTWRGAKNEFTILDERGRRIDRHTVAPGFFPSDLPESRRLELLDASMPAHLAAFRREDPYFPRYHVALPGYIYNSHAFHHAGRWHLFPMWEGDVNYCGWFGLNRMILSHLSSADLVNWELHPFPIRECPEAGAVCNASFVKPDDGSVVGLFLSYSPRTKGAPYLSVARDERLMRFDLDSDIPVIRNEGKGLRGRIDPAVFRADGKWYMTGGRFNEALGKGVFPLYESNDLRTWDFVRNFYEPDIVERIYECAQVLNLDGGRVILTAGGHLNSRGDHFIVGRFTQGEFAPLRGGQWDYGSEPRYIGQFARDDAGRLLAWFTVPLHSEQDALADARTGWKGMHSLPREVTIGEDGAVSFAPSRELAALRGKKTEARGLVLAPGTRVPLSGSQGGQVELRLRLAPTASRGKVGVAFGDGGREEFRVSFDAAASMVEVDLREAWLRGTAAGKIFRFPVASTTAAAGLELRIFFDRSLLEVFADGRSITVPVYPDSPDNLEAFLWADSAGGAIEYAEAWPLRPLAVSAPRTGEPATK
jgi:beta-fructofuranosidase